MAFKLNIKKEISEDKLIEMLNSDKKKDIDNAFKIIYEQNSKMIHSFCHYLCDDQEVAEDIFQESFIRFYNAAKNKQNITNISGYLTTISRNLFYNHVRDSKNKVEIEENTLTENYEQYDKKELMELIISSMDVLEKKYREAFVLREFEGLTYKQIGNKLNISPDNAKVRVIRAKKKIIEVLQPYINDINKFEK
jgi:RNA polymerase sigma-70 factor (ECF subfamily)